MKAVVYDEVGRPEVLHLAEVPTPVPAEDEVLVRVLAVAVDFIQLHIRHGGSGRIGSPKEPAYGLAPLPRIPGGTACVEVVECGAAVTDVEVGERHLTGGLRPGSLGRGRDRGAGRAAGEALWRNGDRRGEQRREAGRSAVAWGRPHDQLANR